MKAQLAAWGALLRANLMPWNEYVENLHALFLKNPENDFLLKLEMSASNEKDTYAILFDIADNLTDAEKPTYANIIFAPLEKIYRANLPIRQFNEIAQRLWNQILFDTNYQEPFVFLTMADDYLDDEVDRESAARELFEQAFSYYKGYIKRRNCP